jgi:hypothetical protein
VGVDKVEILPTRDLAAQQRQHCGREEERRQTDADFGTAG